MRCSPVEDHRDTGRGFEEAYGKIEKDEADKRFGPPMLKDGRPLVEKLDAVSLLSLNGLAHVPRTEATLRIQRLAKIASSKKHETVRHHLASQTWNLQSIYAFTNSAMEGCFPRRDSATPIPPEAGPELEKLVKTC